ncbi:UDP-GlcNAc:betaGal beta-1,3-N-acetylglucosaminyltransferase 7 [Merluccius polli]|uniref:Hexosyltransferase n=1 Tax=Merluccius polli TaxID=89951 RepID=A0AA47NQI0_MERPO|nr:UDP-GlcNAc:betaGal beta-1,3-N-acetylglucosaminyltransferase 7 [Merluccius polli]
MDHLFKRKRSGVLKTLLSASLVLLCVLMIQRFKRVEKDEEGGKALGHTGWWCGSDCAGSKERTRRTGETNGTSEAPPPPPPPAAWDVRAINCSEDASVRTQDWFRRLDPRFHQFVLHRHCRYFPMVLNHPEKCASGDVRLLMVVKSVIEQHDRRAAVRATWGRERTVGGQQVRTLFLLARPTADKDVKTLQKLIEYEDGVHGDILQWDFMDTFFNLTLKEVNFLKWFHIYCPDVQFVFKGDDDVFVNTDNLLDLISFRAGRRDAADLLIGDTISKARPIRNRQSKYYIPAELYNKPYPPYAGGGGFLMSGLLARRLFWASQDLELYPIDDVFLGICLEKLRLTPETHPGFRTFGITKRRSGRMNSEPCFYRGLIVVHKLSPQELLDMWTVVQDQDFICARRTVK